MFENGLIRNRTIMVPLPILKYVKSPSVELQVAVIKRMAHRRKIINMTVYRRKIRDIIENSSEEVHFSLIRGSRYCEFTILPYLQNPSKKLQLAAVKECGREIQYIKNPNEELQLAALAANRDSIRWISFPANKEIARLKANDIERAKEESYIVNRKANAAAEQADKETKMQAYREASRNNSGTSNSGTSNSGNYSPGRGYYFPGRGYYRPGLGHGHSSQY